MNEWDCLPVAAKVGLALYYIITATGVLLWFVRIFLAWYWAGGDWWDRLFHTTIGISAISLLTWAAISIGISIW